MVVESQMLRVGSRMIDLSHLIENNKEKILDIANKRGAYNIRLFGSVARGDFNAKSDIDFLVDFKPGVGLLDWCGLRLDLQDLLGCNVDVATEKTLKSRLKDRVIREAKPL